MRKNKVFLLSICSIVLILYFTCIHFEYDYLLICLWCIDDLWKAFYSKS